EVKPLGEDVSEILEWVPASFKVIRPVRPKLACARCDKIVQAEAPPRPIARGMAGPGLLAHVLVSKYCDHLPWYRQAEIYAREGVELDRATRRRARCRPLQPNRYGKTERPRSGEQNRRPRPRRS